MPRIIFKCPYLKGGSPTVTAHLKNLVGYIATRDGAEKIDPGNTRLAATNKQKELVDQLVQSFPESMELFEYEDYLSTPNRGNASAFITMAEPAHPPGEISGIHRQATSRPAVRYPRPVYWGQRFSGALTDCKGGSRTSRQCVATDHFPAERGCCQTGI